LKCLKGLCHHHQHSDCRWWWRVNMLWCGARCGGSWECRSPSGSIGTNSLGACILARNWEGLLMTPWRSHQAWLNHKCL